MWQYRDKPISSHDDLLPNCTDIVYCITYESDRKYIGKKTVRSIRRIKPTKAQLAIRKNYVRKELKNSPFINYTGSSDLTANEVPKAIEILYQCSDKRSATYLELATLVCSNAIFEDEYLNKNISGRFFDNALEGLLE